jgi:hypothetical protein
VIKLVRESEQHKLEMTALQDKMKAEITALTVQDHKLVLENEQYKSKLAANRQLSVLAVGILSFLPLVHLGFSLVKENEARQQDFSVECFILLFLFFPCVWILLELKKSTKSDLFSQGQQRFPEGQVALSVCELQDLEAGEKQELISRTDEK